MSFDAISTSSGPGTSPGATSEHGSGALSAEEMVVLGTILLDAVKSRYDSARQAIDCDLLMGYEDHGIKQREMRVNGKKVGTHYIQGGKPAIQIDPLMEFHALDALEALGLTERKPKRGWQSCFDVASDGKTVIHKATGEVVDWARVSCPAPSARVRLTEDRDAIASMLSERLGGASIVGLLEG